jgi:hypothetical protein
MKRFALAAACAAVAGLTACGHATVPSAAPASHPAGQAASRPTSLPTGPEDSQPATTPSAVPVNCRQRYDSWKQSPGKGLVAAISAVGSAEAAGNTQELTAALKNARPAVARAARYPVPACADPEGYWEVLMMHVNAAAASTGSAPGFRAAMNGVPQITRELLAELKRTSG